MRIDRRIKGALLDLVPGRALISLKKRHYLRRLKKLGAEDEPDLRIVRRLVRGGDTVVDIGAHVGWYTTVLSNLVCGKGLVLSVEPVPETFEILRWCVRRLRLGNVALFNCAISDSEGSATMYVPRYDSGGWNFYQAGIDDGQGRESSLVYRVKVTSLDELLRSARRDAVTFIKCDVEGKELEVIRGAAKTISTSHPAWLIEVSSDRDEQSSAAATLFHILAQSGYRAYWLHGDRLKRRSFGDRSVNYLFLTADHVRKYWSESACAASLPV